MDIVAVSIWLAVAFVVLLPAIVFCTAMYFWLKSIRSWQRYSCLWWFLFIDLLVWGALGVFDFRRIPGGGHVAGGPGPLDRLVYLVRWFVIFCPVYPAMLTALLILPRRRESASVANVILGVANGQAEEPEAQLPASYSRDKLYGGLFILITVTVIGYGWVGYRWIRNHSSQKVAVAPRRPGVNTTYLGDRLVGVRFDPGVAKSLDFISGNQDLETLALDGCQFSNEELQHIKGLSRLRLVMMSTSSISDAGVGYLSDVPNLEVLALRQTKITDDGLRKLATLKKLQVLSLEKTQISNAGLANLQGAPSLQRLHLDDTLIDDAGLKHLMALPMLNEVSLDGTRVTPEGVSALQEACPMLKIAVSFGPNPP